MWVHFERQPGEIICDARLFTEATNVVDHVTCPDCALRLLAFLHRDTSVLLKTLAGAIAILQKDNARLSELAAEARRAR